MQISSSAAVSNINTQTESIEQSHVNKLEKRKQQIMDQKQIFREKSAREGNSSHIIDSKIKEYDIQISNLEQEISKLISKQRRTVLDAEKKNYEKTRKNVFANRQNTRQPVRQNNINTIRPESEPVYTPAKSIQAYTNVFSKNNTGHQPNINLDSINQQPTQDNSQISAAEINYRQMVIDSYKAVSSNMNIYQYLYSHLIDVTV